MKKNLLPKGPSLEVTFHVDNEEIIEISLEAKKTKGLSWTIKGKKCPPQLETAIGEWLTSYASKKQPSTRLPINLSLLPQYTSTVLSVLKHVPFACYVSYQELGALTKKPKAARAVGGACGRNPFPLVIPCHRVLAQNAGIGGFSAGPGIKELLLDFEGIPYNS